MSIVHLSSIGQNPANFTNDFPQQINLAPRSEVRCLGFSGVQADVTANAGRSKANFVNIKTGINDSFVVLHGNVADGTSPVQYQNVPFAVKIPAGTYSTANSEFTDIIAKSLNDSDNAQEFYKGSGAGASGWSVSYNSAMDVLTIKVVQARNLAEEAGMWDYYLNAVGSIITPAAFGSPTVLSPQKTGNVGGMFINKRQGFLGNNGIPVGSTSTAGYTLAIAGTAGANLQDFAVVHGIVPISNLTIWDQVSNTTEVWAKRKANIKRSEDQVPNGFTDWAYPESQFPWMAFGMTISPEDGRVGILTSNMDADFNGELKGTDNQEVTWVGPGIDPTLTIRLNISPRYDSTTNDYQLVFLVDYGTGVYTIVQTMSCGSFANQDVADLMSAEHVYHCVYYRPDYISSTTRDCKVTTQNKYYNQAGGIANPLADTTIIWNPLTPDIVCPDRLKTECGDFSLQHCNGFGHEHGYEDYYSTPTNATTTGWLSDSAGMVDNVNVSPIIITCPSLPVTGYVGSAGATGVAGVGCGGAAAPILAVAGVRGNVNTSGFSGLTQAEWIKLNNEFPLRLDRLNIKLVDETNRQYTGLAPDFSTWLMFRSPAVKQPYYHGKSVSSQK